MVALILEKDPKMATEAPTVAKAVALLLECAPATAPAAPELGPMAAL